MDQAERIERDSSLGANTCSGLLAIAAAAKCAVGSSAAAKELATRVLAEAGEDLRDVPGEAENTAKLFNRMMDTVLDAANASHGFATRVQRRAHMARALELGGFVMVDVAALATLVAAKIERLERACYTADPGARANLANLPACAAETEAAGGEHHLDFMEGSGEGYGASFLSEPDGGPDPLGGFLG